LNLERTGLCQYPLPSCRDAKVDRTFTQASAGLHEHLMAGSDGGPCTWSHWSRRCRCRASEARREIRGAPHIGFSRLILRIRSRTSLVTAGQARTAVSDLPDPERSETFPVPGDHRFRLDDDQCGSPVAPQLRQPCQEEAIRSGQLRPLHRAMQGAELVTKSEDLNLKCGAVAERSQNGCKQRLRRRAWARIDVRGATSQCINQIQIYENRSWSSEEGTEEAGSSAV
jgi:hypothetical protein